MAMLIAMTALLIVPVHASASGERSACHEMMDDCGNCDHRSQGSDQTCPDDMNCQNACASLSASTAFLIPAALTVYQSGRISIALAQNTRALEHLTRLNAPPPRA